LRIVEAEFLTGWTQYKRIIQINNAVTDLGRRCDSRNASLLTRCGELFLLHSSSEYVRMSLSARRVLQQSCHVAVPPRRRSTVVTEPTDRDESVVPTVSSVSRASPVDQALINGTQRSSHEYVSTVTSTQLLYRWLVSLAVSSRAVY